MNKSILIPIMLILIALPVLAVYTYTNNNLPTPLTNYYDCDLTTGGTYSVGIGTGSAQGNFHIVFDKALEIKNASATFRLWFSGSSGSPYKRAWITNDGVDIVLYDDSSGSDTGIITRNVEVNDNVTDLGIRFHIYDGSTSTYNHNMALYELYAYVNGINIKLFDENNNTCIPAPATKYLILTQANGSTLSTSGDYSILHISNDELTNANTSLNFYSAPDHLQARQLSKEISPSTFYNLIGYVARDSSTTTFRLRDKETSGAIEGASINVKKFIGGDFVDLVNMLTDVSGGFKFDYIPFNQYYFYYNYTGYQEKNFTLNPIIFDSYNVGMTTLLTYDLEQVSMLPNIATYRNAYSNNLSITYYNPAVDSFTLYGFNISYPGSGGWLERNGTTPTGSVLNREVNITGATLGDKVYLNMYYQRVGETERTNLNYAYYILISPGKYTWANNKIDSEGIGATLGIFEKIIITTLLVIMAGGLAMMVAGPIAGGVVGLVVMGFLAYMGLAPISAVIVSLLVGFIVIAWRSSQ